MRLRILAALVSFLAVVAPAWAAPPFQTSDLRVKEKPWVDIRAYGAVGDGVTNDRAAIVAAIAAASGTCVYVPNGNFLVSGTDGLNITTDDTCIRGTGESSRLTFTGLNSAEAGIQVTGDRVYIGNLRLQASSQLSTNEHGILLDGVVGGLIENVFVDDFDRGIWVNDSGDAAHTNRQITIRKCRVTDSFGYGIHLAWTEESALIDNFVSGARSQDGIKTSRFARQIRMIGNHSEANTRDGFDFYDGCLDCVIQGNVAKGNTLSGFDIKGTPDVTFGNVVRGSTFTGNLAIQNTSAGFHVQEVRSVTFTANRSEKNLDNGWQLNDVAGSIFSGNASRANGRHGWRLVTLVKDNVFSGNSAHDNDFGDLLGGNGWILEGDTTGNLFIANNSTNGVLGENGGQDVGFTFIGAGVTGNVIDDLYLVGSATQITADANFYTQNEVTNVKLGTAALVGWQSNVSGTQISKKSISIEQTGGNATADVKHQTGSQVQVQAQTNAGRIGTTSNHLFRIITNNADRWRWDTSGHFLPENTATYNIGSASLVPLKTWGVTFESTATTGTAPVVVASTTKVANLNVDQVDGFSILQGSGTLDFANQASAGCEELSVTVTGATAGNSCSVGVPTASVVANSSFTCRVSAADTVQVKHCTVTSGDPASGSFKATVIQ